MEEEEQGNLCINIDSHKVEKNGGSILRFHSGGWTKEEDENIKILVRNFGYDWKTIASFLPGRTDYQCMYRWKVHLDPSVVQRPWTKEEDDKIVELVGKHGTRSWSLIANYLNGRMGKECREHWRNHLNPLLNKNPWTKEEDLIIYKAYCILGDRWAAIAKMVPGRSENDVKSHWNSTIKLQAELGFYKDEEDSISLDIQQFVEGEKDFNCDVVLDAVPVTPEVVRLKAKKKQVENLKEHLKPMKKKAVPPPKTMESRRDYSSCSPPLSRSSSSSPSSCSGVAPATSSANQKTFTEAALRMIAEDMLPLSFVEGAGFRSFMSTISPQYSKLSQRAVGLQLYNDVERTIKPHLIRDLKACLASTKGRKGAIHATINLWAGGHSHPVEEPVIVVQLHFLSENWQICRPTVAFRHVNQKNLSTAVARELEGVLLSYGIFPSSIGYVLTNQAKEALAANSLFCDYKIICSSQRGESDGDDMVAYLADQMSETESPFSQLQIGTRNTCVIQTLQLVIKEALKNSRVVENLLSQVHNVVAFFRSNAYWNEVLLKEWSVSLFPSSNNCRWNSMMVSLRRMIHKPAWVAIMTLLAQARIEAKDPTSVPPLVMVKHEQVVDILSLLEPFEEVMQALQGNSVTISNILPSLVGLDKALESHVTNYTHFTKALRTGLHTHLQALIDQKDVILATVLDPRIKLQPFADAKQEEQTCFLTPPSKFEARSIVEAAVESMEASSSSSVEPNEDQKNEQSCAEEREASMPTEVSTADSYNSCSGDRGNDLKRKAIFSLQPPAKTMRMSEVDMYLSEQLLNSDSTLLYWKSVTRFPNLQSIARKLLAVPATSGGFDRLYPMAACIIRAKRNRIPPHTTERLLLYRDSSRTKHVTNQSVATKR